MAKSGSLIDSPSCAIDVEDLSEDERRNIEAEVDALSQEAGLRCDGLPAAPAWRVRSSDARKSAPGAGSKGAGGPPRNCF